DARGAHRPREEGAGPALRPAHGAGVHPGGGRQGVRPHAGAHPPDRGQGPVEAPASLPAEQPAGGARPVTDAAGHGTSGNVATPSTVGVIWSRSCLMRQVGAAGRGRRGVVTMEPQQTTSSLRQPLPLTVGGGSSLPQGDPNPLPQGGPNLSLPQGDPDSSLPQGDPDSPGPTSADCVQSLQRIEGLLA